MHTHSVTITPNPATPRQTRSMSRSASHSSSAPSASSDYVRSLEKQLAESQKRIRELEHDNGELHVHCICARDIISQQQNQLHAKAASKGTRTKRTAVEARVLNFEEGCQEIEQLRQEAHVKDQRQTAEVARKSAGEQERRKRRADRSLNFTGLLNKSR